MADTDTLDAVVVRMLGGSAVSFLTEYRGKKPLYVPAAGVEYAGIYDVEDFLADLVTTQPVPYIAVGARNGSRCYTKNVTLEELRNAVWAGGVASMKMSNIWHGQEMPERWTWIRALFGHLYRATSMLYMSPARSEDVNLFLAGPESQLGTHFDTTEAFTLQLYGERKWVVDEELRLDNVLEIYRDPNWRPAQEVEFQGATREITLRAGDAIYVPAYAIHRVTGVSWSVSVNLGVRAFNEIDFVEYLLEVIRMTRYADYKPVPNFPEAMEKHYAEAKMELLRRVRTLLQQVEMAAMGSALASLMLPPTLSLEPAPLPGPVSNLDVFASGFRRVEG
jgi:ribosomal protein L16 Arg81 hydroxylase